ncbi:hypothetical protein H1C71_033943 [Ictidomys tridecemlineatus]|uniref:tripartite motif-containing protein 44-like n=1 Tax=Ictidomys tridecemlineatus TaxID=43179 RepID=UPI00038BFBE2|nr:tripartite motif-containing protein 44-like [Ictidomys tridecemlineatus]KAG3283375.1 hypothetical protein H1C71_033943 [Ictidomys tridecemlineatus]
MVTRVCAAYEVHDGTCDQCEPDQAPRADEVCRECGFYYCTRHADEHKWRFPSHHLVKNMQGLQARTSRAGGERPGKEEITVKVEPPRQELESALEDSDSEGGSETGEESEEEDSEPESEMMEEDIQGRCMSERETKAESKFDPKRALEEKRTSKRKYADPGLDLSPYSQKDRPIICVLGTQQGHQLYTLDEAFEELISKDSTRVKAAIIELVEKLKLKSSDPKVTQKEIKEFIQKEFKKVQQVLADEEHKAVHLVDIQEEMDRDHLTEILADLQSRMDKPRTQMPQAKEQLGTSNKSAKPRAGCA